MVSFFKTKQPQPKLQQLEAKSRKICLLLVEDVDIVFEQDEGFTAALGQLLTTSKRPVILTTTDETAFHIQKFVNTHHLVRFRELKSEKLSIWLQLVCLLEGMHIRKENLRELLDYFRGDIRKCLLQLQFLVEPFVAVENGMENQRENDTSEADLELDNLKMNVLQDYSQRITVECCLVYEHVNAMSLPRNIGLGTIWWNMPNISKTANDKSVLRTLSETLESLAFVDVLFNKMKLDVGLEPIFSNTNARVEKDSLELRENLCFYSEKCDVALSIGHTVLENCINVYGNRQDELCLDMSVPSLHSKR